MCNSNSNSPNLLDNILADKGSDDLKGFFNELSRKDLQNAAVMVNHKDLQFPTLFVLKKEIQTNNLFEGLNEKNKTALFVVNEILSSGKHDFTQKHPTFDFIEIVHSTLRWMLKSGFDYDGMNDEYDRVLDISSLLLTKLYKDSSLLHIMADRIFKRYKNGFLIHDLVWAFFQCANPHTLVIIGERLLSQDKDEVDLACKLLNFIPGINQKNKKEEKYALLLNWLKENSPYLKYTGESFQQTSNPSPYKVVLEGKYLCKNVCCDTGKSLCPLSEEEYDLLDKFKKLDYSTKILLSNFSLRIYHSNIYLWNIWHGYSLEDQIKIARIGGTR